MTCIWPASTSISAPCSWRPTATSPLPRSCCIWPNVCPPTCWKNWKSSTSAAVSASPTTNTKTSPVWTWMTWAAACTASSAAGRKRPATPAASWWSPAAMWWPNAASCWGASTPPRPTVTDAMPVPTWVSTCWCVPPCTTPSMMWKCTVRARRARIPRPWNRASWATSAKAATSWPRTASCPCCMKATCWACWTPGLTVS